MDLSAGSAIREDPGSAAAAASTTTALAFLRLITFRTGTIKALPGIQCVRIRRTWVLILPFVVFIVAPCNAARVCGLACFTGRGRMTIFLNNTYYTASSDTGIRVVILYVWYEMLLFG